MDVIAVIAVIAAAASFFMCGGKHNASELVGDSIKSDTAKVRPIEQKKNTLKKDTATSNAINKFVKPSQPKNEER